MLFTDVQRSVRLNKKKKSTNTSPYPDEVIDRLARAFYPAILACWNSEEGQREFAAWQGEQSHHIPSKEKQSVPDGERPVVHIAVVCGFFRAHPSGRTLFLFCPERANCAITYYNPAQPSKCLYYTTICATFLLNAHLSGCQNYRAFLSERLRLLCQKIPDTLCSRPRNNYIRLNSALVHAIPF